MYMDEDEAIIEEADLLAEEADQLEHQRQVEAEMAFMCGTRKYHNNGVEITSRPADMNYVIETNKYTVYWYVGSCALQIYAGHKILYDLIKSFDMSYFAILKDATLKPGELEFVWSSAEHVNHQVEEILAFRPIKKLPQDIGAFV